MADVIGVYCLVWVYTHKFTQIFQSVVALCLRYLKKADGFVQLVILSIKRHFASWLSVHSVNWRCEYTISSGQIYVKWSNDPRYSNAAR